MRQFSPQAIRALALIIDGRMLVITFYYDANITAIKLMFLLIIDYSYEGFFFILIEVS